MTKFLMHNGWRAALCGAVLALTQSPCFAQSTSGAAGQQLDESRSNGNSARSIHPTGDREGTRGDAAED